MGEEGEVVDLHVQELVCDWGVVEEGDWMVEGVEARVDLQVEQVAVDRDVGVQDSVQVGKGEEVGGVHPVLEEVHPSSSFPLLRHPILQIARLNHR